MSKKPTLTIRYPEASEKALKLTEAMVKRSPGKRTVETESEDPIFPDGGDLFSSFIRCKTSTGVDLTLTLNPTSMDYALETLIRPNLNAEERRRILGESEDEEQAELGLDGGAQAAQAPGQDKSCTAEVRSASLADEEQKVRHQITIIGCIRGVDGWYRCGFDEERKAIVPLELIEQDKSCTTAVRSAPLADKKAKEA